MKQNGLSELNAFTNSTSNEEIPHWNNVYCATAKWQQKQ